MVSNKKLNNKEKANIMKRENPRITVGSHRYTAGIIAVQVRAGKAAPCGSKYAWNVDRNLAFRTTSYQE